MQTFKRLDRAPWGKYRSQYVYRCRNTACRNQIVEPLFRPAADIIDWSLTGTRIGERKRPLADKTMARITAGIERYWAPLLVPVEGRDGKTAAPVDQPARTMTTRNETGLLIPTGGTWRTEAVPTSEPIPTRTPRENDGIAFPAFVAELRGGSCDARPVAEPLATVTASGNHHALITSYYGNGGTTPAAEALPTVTTLERHGLLTRRPAPAPPPAIDINDVFFRMLEPREITAAMDFPGDYQMVGTRREQVRLAGNAVTPPAARDLVGLVVETLTGEPLPTTH
jgi:DNA (cytosine-5)-methyltransferase 1